MLCTQCSKPVRPVVAVDIDGTLGDYHGHFQQFAEGWLGKAGVHMDRYTGAEQYSHWFCTTYDVDVTTFRAIKLAYRQGGLKRTMPPHPEAHSMVASLRQRAEVWLTTTRPWERYDRVDPDTREWLRRMGIAYDALLFDEDKIATLYSHVDTARVVAVLDDEPEVLCYVDYGMPILLQTQYNELAWWDGVRASSLPGALFIINQLIDEWIRQHDE